MPPSRPPDPIEERARLLLALAAGIFALTVTFANDLSGAQGSYETVNCRPRQTTCQGGSGFDRH